MFSYDQLIDIWAEVESRLRAERRVVLCNAVHVPVVEALVRANNMTGLIKVKTTGLAARNQVMVIDPNVHSAYQELWGETW